VISRQLVRTERTLEEEWRQVLQGSTSTGAEKDESSTRRVWAAGFHHVTARTRLARVLELMNCLFLKFFTFFSGRGEPWITEPADTESADMGAHLYM
jgi:hypothetical protein